MKFQFSFDKLLQHEVRLGIMSVLVVNDEIDYNTLKQILDVTDGNLSSNVSTLEKNGYILVQKEFVGKKPKTTYQATLEGRKAFSNHLKALEQFVKSNK